ncbi:protein kinase family protein [Herbaspirillum huttiense]|uniref:Protein kinase family protein n=2 Tax=Herbaspirillum huttiense TaxID=863372 RepID=A0AAJ2LUL4_9BURK|nr:protein kinase family protein [Herbaspirillum huttiense]MDR9836086.1 protein kinase family protein [Herbaspirillum huttiense]
MAERLVEFLRKKDFLLEEELGQGACGKTVLLFDSTIDEHFACKKYSPLGHAPELFEAFVREIKLLHRINHVNVVRVFNYYLFPEKTTGYILMEYVQGMDIEEYLEIHPEEINEVFFQVVAGFAHLEENNILHRDIRPANILVTDSGTVKIIDLGFGKHAVADEDYEKSISLNWWCELPSEFKYSKYDFSTEVYFVGKLFEKIILETGIQQFKHDVLLGKMCLKSPQTRVSSFLDITKILLSSDFESVDFGYDELETYRNFSNSLASVVANIEIDTKYYVDPIEILSKLEQIYKKVMLEENIPNPTIVVSCFVNGSYKYLKNKSISVSTLKSFLNLFRAVSREKKNIIVANLLTRLDSVPRYQAPIEDDIPF